MSNERYLRVFQSELEGVDKNLPLVLVTSNTRKIEQFSLQVPHGVEFRSTSPSFDEEAIKREIDVQSKDGVFYAVEISREKLSRQRKMEVSSGVEDDALLLVSDSMLLIPNEENGLSGVNRDGMSDQQKKEAIDSINSSGKIIFCGALSFGRRCGQSILTTVSYVEIPLSKPIDHFPILVDEIPSLVSDLGYTIGKVEFKKGDDNKVFPEFQKICETDDFDVARPYISGVTSGAIEFAKNYGLVDSKISPIIESLVADHPFSTLGFYKELAPSDETNLEEFYGKLLENRDDFFENNGGNCTFFTLALEKKMTEMNVNSRIVIYPSWKPDKNNGHSGLLIDFDGKQYLSDPGLGVPFLIPTDSDIPIAPIRIDNKQFTTIVRDLDGDLVPDVVVIRKNGATVMQSQKLIGLSDYLNIAPAVLADLHRNRRTIKHSINSNDGCELVGVVLDKESGKVTFKQGSTIFEQFLSEDFETDNELGKRIFERCCVLGFDPTIVLEVIKNLAKI